MNSTSKLVVSGIVVIVGVIIAYTMIFKIAFKSESIEGKRVLVTGASSGIGEQLAYKYAELGAKVMITARREDLLKRVMKKCQEIGKRLPTDYGYMVADMYNLDATKQVVEETVAKLGGLDILVLNHAWMLPLTEWKNCVENLTTTERVMKINFLSYVYLASHAEQYLHQSSGHIIVVSSWAGFLKSPLMAPYSASKSAVYTFFKSLRKENYLKKSPVSITVCHLGFIETDKAKTILKNSIFFDLKEKSVLFSIDKSPAHAARAILEAGANHETDMLHPYLLGLFLWYFPNVSWYLMKDILVLN